MKLNPCIPKDWKEYKIDYIYGNSIYHITVNNINGKNTGVTKVKLNGKEVENEIKLSENGGIFNIEAWIRKLGASVFFS